MIDENSEASSTCDASLTFKQESSDVVGYRVVHLPTEKQVPTTVVTPNQQYFVIHDANAIFVNNRVNNPRKIAPKTVDAHQTQQVQIGPPPAKKRDDRRRATHNEVERRRRDKINHWILKLGSLIPADGLPGGERDRVNVVNSAVESKGVILSKACEYISSMKSNYEDVSECLKASEEVNNKLQSENQFLKELLDKHGIAYDVDGDITILS
ncbi:upstream stimulatory factor 1 isoform X2 [Bradysia coprophila]|nr:upstream stimulatory factor 1 isoform X2 [Bradysia coprophila]